MQGCTLVGVMRCCNGNHLVTADKIKIQVGITRKFYQRKRPEEQRNIDKSLGKHSSERRWQRITNKISEQLPSSWSWRQKKQHEPRWVAGLGRSVPGREPVVKSQGQCEQHTSLMFKSESSRPWGKLSNQDTCLKLRSRVEWWKSRKYLTYISGTVTTALLSFNTTPNFLLCLSVC